VMEEGVESRIGSLTVRWYRWYVPRYLRRLKALLDTETSVNHAGRIKKGRKESFVNGWRKLHCAIRLLSLLCPGGS